jgi:thiamine biosynthesis lipoprotein
MQRRRFMTASLGLAAGSAAIGAAVFWPRAGAVPDAADSTGLAAGKPALPVVTGADLAFGTTISIQVAHRDQALATRAIAAAIAAAKRVDQLMSLHREDSQVMQLNRTGILAAPHADVFNVLAYSRQLAQQTGGAFDITVQPLWTLYAAAALAYTLPDPGARRQAMQATGWQRMMISSGKITLEPGMAITLNGVAQGYAVDQARAVLVAHGVTRALIDTGEFGARGERAADSPWTVGVRHPRDAQALVGMVPMDGRCLATSGDYETWFTPDYLHHHIFDPATGDSPTELASVSVVAPSGLQADGLSTACMVLGWERSMREVARLPDVDLLLVDKAGRVWCSDGFPAAPAV